MTSNGADGVLVLGVSGMLGNVVLRFLCAAGHSVVGTVRSQHQLQLFAADLRPRIVAGFDIENADALVALFARIRPTVVVNCIGMVKQLAGAEDPMMAIPLNALLPHRLARLCAMVNARLVHISTDCVFAGTKGGYREDDPADAADLYGRSKYLGEVDYPHAVTLRTSIIGHELTNAHGLLGWFLAQHGTVRGYTRAIFSGLPTVELARIIREHVMSHPQLHGVYHVSAAPIAKYELLHVVREVYNKPIEIQADDSLVIDRSLDSSRFRRLTGYVPPSWPELIRAMHRFG